MRKVWIITMMVFSIWGCNKNESISPFKPREAKELFLAKDDLGMYDGGMRFLYFEEEYSQIILSEKLNGEKNHFLFCIQYDDLNRRCAVDFMFDGGMEMGGRMTITVTSKGLEKELKGKKEVTLLKNFDDRLWLWDEKEATGYLVITKL